MRSLASLRVAVRRGGGGEEKEVTTTGFSGFSFTGLIGFSVILLRLFISQRIESLIIQPKIVI